MKKILYSSLLAVALMSTYSMQPTGRNGAAATPQYYDSAEVMMSPMEMSDEGKKAWDKQKEVAINIEELKSDLNAITLDKNALQTYNKVDGYIKKATQALKANKTFKKDQARTKYNMEERSAYKGAKKKS